MRRVASVSLAVAGSVLGAASSAYAQVPTPPVPPHPQALDQLDPLGLLFDFPELDIDLPQCRGNTTCSVGPKQLRCRKTSDGVTADRSCALKVAGAVAECTDVTQAYEGIRYHQRVCRVAMGGKTIARCEDTFSAYVSYHQYRSCSVGGVAYTCEQGNTVYPPAPNYCRLTGAPRPR